MKSVSRIISLILVLPYCAHAALGLPRGCETIGYEFRDGALVLNQLGEQTIYFIQNIRQSNIHLKHGKSNNEFMKLGWQAQLSHQRWAAIAVSEKDMDFKCEILNKGQANPINCQTAIRICQYPRVKFALSNQGTY